MFRIIGIAVVGVAYVAWQGFKGMTFARNAWGTFLTSGEMPFNGKQKKNNKWEP